MEWATLPVTEMFLRDNQDDSDFSAFVSVRFFDEQKHPLVLMEHLRRSRPDLVPSEAKQHALRFEFDRALATQTLHFGDEARAAFAKVGVPMASARRTAQALHPTNLPVNVKLFPRDTS